MNLLIWTNCQGNFIYTHWLSTLPYFKNAVVSYVINYEPLSTTDIFKTCDVIIYQPTQDSSKYIQLLQPYCIKVCIPVIYADIFCIFEEGGKYVGGASLDKYRDRTLQDILELYDKGEYDFELKGRFEKSMNYLIEKEALCDIKVSDMILHNYKHIRLFDTQNHPNGIIGAYMAKEICKFLKIDEPVIDEFTQANIVIQQLQWKDSLYAKRELNQEFIKEDNNAHYRNLLIQLYNNPTLIKRKYLTLV
jgi:hypothetical protein